MKKILLLVTSCLLSVSLFAGCSGGDKSAIKDYDTITMVWYPNESGGDLEEARNAIGDVVKKATGKNVEHKLTTDYAIAIEAMTNNTAHLAFMGAQGYVEANAKNDKIQPLVVPSGKSGTIDDAVYYSWIASASENSSKYKNGDNYSIGAIEGNKMSFVSNSSTSGFKVPAKSIATHFSKVDKWKDLNAEGLMEGGKNNFFSEVMYGGSHQGSAVNLLNGKSDIGAFCDTVLINYIDLVKGEFNAEGSEYKIKDKADEPFNNLGGKEFTVIESTPVLNSPFVVNKSILNEEDQKLIKDAFLSDEVSNNDKIFLPKGATGSGFFGKEGNEKFLIVEDSWFNPVRELSK